MKNQVHQIKILYLVFGVIFISCKSDNREILTLTIVNEMQDCEENNIFYRIINPMKEVVNQESARDSLVLLLFSDSVKSHYDLFYPSFPKERYQFTVKGFFLEERVGLNNSYGCPGSRKFKIVEVLEVTNVTNIMTYPIDNN